MWSESINWVYDGQTPVILLANQNPDSNLNSKFNQKWFHLKKELDYNANMQECRLFRLEWEPGSDGAFSFPNLDLSLRSFMVSSIVDWTVFGFLHQLAGKSKRSEQKIYTLKMGSLNRTLRWRSSILKTSFLVSNWTTSKLTLASTFLDYALHTTWLLNVTFDQTFLLAFH